MIKLPLLLAISWLVLSPVSAQAALTGNDVLSSCQAAVRLLDNNGAPAAEQYDSGWCIGWVSAALQLTKGYNEWSTSFKQKPSIFQFCVPDSGIPPSQGVRILVKYLKEHPEQLQDDGMGLTIAALKNSFPCK